MLLRAVLLLYGLKYVFATQIILEANTFERTSQTFSKAHEKCKEQGKILPIEQGRENLDKIQKALESRELNIAWFGLQRVKTEEWLYTDGRKHDHIRRSERSNMDCAALRPVGSYATECSKKVDGYICERKGCGGCPSGHCYGGVCLSIHCEKLNWYDASSSCFRDNMKLSVQSDHVLNKTLTNENCKEVWIGLARAKWNLLLPGGESDIARSYRWNKYDGGSCAVVSLINDDVMWESASCDQEHPVLCFNYSFENSSLKPSDVMANQMSTTEPGAPSTHRSSEEKGSRQLIIYALVGVIGSIFVIVSLACFLTSCLGKRRIYKVSQEAPCTGNGRAIEFLEPTTVNAVHHQDSDPEAIQFYAMCARDSTQDMTSSSEEGDLMPPEMPGQYIEPYQGTGILVLTESQESFSRPDPCYYGNSDYLRPLRASPVVTDV